MTDDATPGAHVLRPGTLPSAVVVTIGRSRRLGRTVLIVLALVLAYLAFTLVQVWRASLDDDTRPAQAIVVLGAAQYDGRPSPALRARLDHAIGLYRDGYAPIVVVTGGRQPGDRYTEAGAGHRYLREQGIPESALRLEVTSSNSWESLAAAARFLREEGITDVLLVSDPYHSYRIAEIAEEVGLDAGVSPTPGHALRPSVIKALLRETGAVAVGRLTGYRRLTNLDRAITSTTSPRP